MKVNNSNLLALEIKCLSFLGWIITKNEKGKIKVATCGEDESNSNIYDKTRGNSLPNHELFKD